MYRNFSHQGFIEMIVGCMFAGKTQELLRRITVFQIAGKGIILFKPAFDERWGEPTEVKSHDSRYSQVAHPVRTVEQFNKILAMEEKKQKIVTITFDEIQFFPPEFVLEIEKLAQKGYHIICAGLDRGFNDELFATVAQLLSYAEIVMKLSAVCVICGETATKTQRIDENKNPISPADVKNVLGGSDVYQARCRNCFVFFPV